MSINLEKSHKISLEKEAGTPLKNVFIGLGWNTGKNSIDLDASAVLLDENRSSSQKVTK